MKITEKAGLTPAQKKKLYIRRKSWVRSLIQLIFFVAMPGAFAAGFSGVKYLFQWIGTGEILQINSFVKALIGLSLFTILFGRYFCGYVCAFGSFGDFVYFLSGQIQKKVFHRKKQYRLPEKLVIFGQKIKYLVLAIIVILCAFGIYSTLNGTSPWDVFSMLTSAKFHFDGYITGLILLFIIIVGMALQERFFCQFLCPMGAIFALLPISPLGTLNRNSDNCIKGCNACAAQCPVRLKLEKDGFRNGECIACEKCTGVCPKSNITRSEQKILKNEIISVLIKAAIFFIMGIYLGFCRFF